MTKLKLANSQDFESLLNELKEDEGVALSFQNENIPNSFPCIAVHYFSDDVDFGHLYNIEFVYPSDFT